jgi:hypothetical protein
MARVKKGNKRLEEINLVRSQRIAMGQKLSAKIFSSATDRVMSETGLSMSVRRSAEQTQRKAYALMQKYNKASKY